MPHEFRGRLNRVVRGLQLRLTNGPLRLVRNAARMDLVSPGPARIAAKIEVLYLRPARIAAQIEVLYLRLARNAARLTLCFRDVR
ncbi:unnamed protein product [Prunus armeniaca]